MHQRLPDGLREATRLTRAGRLTEATAVIQRTLRGRPVPGASAASSRPRPTADRERLPAVAAGARPAIAPLPTPTPAAGRFIEGAYRQAEGTRAYKLYIPSGYTGQAVPLLVLLHGCTQDATDFAVGTRMNAFAEAETFLVVYPEQAPSANPSGCWNWFESAHQQRGRGEPALIAGITRQIMTAYHVDAQRVYAVGMSAGGAMAAILAVTYPDLLAAIGVHSGLAYGAAHDLRSAVVTMRRGGMAPAAGAHAAPARGTALGRVVPLILFQGDRDTTVHPRNADQVLSQWTAAYAAHDGSARGSALRVTTDRGQVPGGHAVTRSVYRDAQGQRLLEGWLIHGAGHAWPGGDPRGSFTDPKGPDASRELLRFFREHRLEGAGPD